MTSDDVKMESVNKCCGHERKYWSLQWMFCPFCGTSKPVEKELVEKLYEDWVKSYRVGIGFVGIHFIKKEKP